MRGNGSESFMMFSIENHLVEQKTTRWGMLKTVAQRSRMVVRGTDYHTLAVGSLPVPICVLKARQMKHYSLHLSRRITSEKKEWRGEFALFESKHSSNFGHCNGGKKKRGA